MLLFSWYPLMSGSVNYSLTGINNMPSDKYKMSLSPGSPSRAVLTICAKRRKANKMCVVLYFILLSSFISHVFVNGWNPGVTS